MIRSFKCICGQRLKADSTLAGKSVICPACKKRGRVPQQASEAPSAKQETANRQQESQPGAKQIRKRNTEANLPAGKQDGKPTHQALPDSANSQVAASSPDARAEHFELQCGCGQLITVSVELNGTSLLFLSGSVYAYWLLTREDGIHMVGSALYFGSLLCLSIGTTRLRMLIDRQP